MNKKRIDKLIVWKIIGIVFIVSLLILGFKSIFESELPEFKITEEECWMRIGLTKTQCFYDNESLYIDVIECMKNEEWVEIKEEVCKQVEVTEFGECVGGHLCRENPECCLEHYVKVNELTTDWLDRNCAFYLCDLYNCRYYKFENLLPFDFPLNFGDVRKWKCGNYYVEVEK